MVSEQIVELEPPGLLLLLHCPGVLEPLEEGGDYRVRFPDGKDVVDYLNECRLGAIALRSPEQPHWLHFSSATDRAVIAAASDHARLGVEIHGGRLCVRRGDELGRWTARCPDERVVCVQDGIYEVTACMMPNDGAGTVRIYFHFAPTLARPDLGYSSVPELRGERWARTTP